MMKNILLSLFLACGLIMACSDDETPSPSYEERDWWVLTYDPNADELDQLIYKIYDETGLRFFYNDTLGTETRYTYGEPYTHYQTYMMGYDFKRSGKTTSANYRLSYDRGIIKDFIDYYFLVVDPVLNTSSFFYKHFFIVDTVFNSTGNSTVLPYWNDVANATVVVSMTDVTKKHFNTLTEDERKGLMINVLLKQVYDLFGGDGAGNNEELQGFFDITNNSAEWPTTLTGAPYAKGFKLTTSTPDRFPDGKLITEYDNLPYRFGVLSVRSVTSTYYNFIFKQVDFMDYLTLVLTHTDAEIREMYGHQDLIMQKYEYLKAVLEKNGLGKFLGYEKKLGEVED